MMSWVRPNRLQPAMAFTNSRWMPPDVPVGALSGPPLYLVENMINQPGTVVQVAGAGKRAGSDTDTGGNCRSR